MRPDKVIPIFDTRFGEKLRSLDLSVAIWIISSAENDVVTHRLWKNEGVNITTFRPQRFVELLDTVDQHHHGWSEIEIVGEKLTEDASDATADYSALSATASDHGFLVRR